jgi:hypothetical protein
MATLREQAEQLVVKVRKASRIIYPEQDPAGMIEAALTRAADEARDAALEEAAGIADATVEMWRAKDPNATFQHIARSIRDLKGKRQ